MELGAAKTQNAKQSGQIKQLRKSGMDNNTRKQLESQLESANKRAESSARELHMCNKKHSSELKKYRNDAIGADKDGERMRDRLERAESELKEVQMEARILSLKLKNERRDYKAKVPLYQHVLWLCRCVFQYMCHCVRWLSIAVCRCVLAACLDMRVRWLCVAMSLDTCVRCRHTGLGQ